MFARHISVHVKPEMADRFGNEVAGKIVPLMKQQKGFSGALTLGVAGGPDAICVTLWDTKDHADSFNHNYYPQVMKMLSQLVDGHPMIRSTEVMSSTL